MNVAAATAIAAAMLGCAPKITEPVVAVEDKVYTVTPADMAVKAGIVTGQVTEMKILERVEKISGKVETPARLSANLKLKNTSSDQTVRLVGGTLRYIDMQGHEIKIEEARTEPTIRFMSTGSAQLDPGQDTSQSVEVDFPAAALKAKKLKEIRFDLTYVPAPFKLETASLPVVIGGQ